MHQGLALAGFHLGVGVRRAAAQHTQGVAVQIFEQLALPGIPHLGAGATDVGHGQQVKRRQVTLVAHPLGEGGDDSRVAQIGFLGHAAHGQVFGHQELDELLVLAGDAVVAAEALHLLGAQLGMVTPAPFGDVVEKGGHEQQPGLVPASGQLRAKRVFMGMFGHEKAPHITQHHDDVLVHRVDVEQVVLHLPHDAAEHPQVAPQHRGLVHQPHGVGDAGGLLQDAQEGGAVDRVAAEGRVHHMAGVVERPLGARRQALQAQRGLIQQEGFQDGVWLAQVKLVVHHLDHASLVQKTLVDRRRHVGGRVEPVCDVQQQDLVELRHRLGRPVVAPHQHFAGAHGLLVGTFLLAVAKGLGHGILQVKHQPVFAAVGGDVQARADQAQQGFVALDLPHFVAGGEAVGGQLVPGAAKAGCLGHPQDGLQVAQAAGGFLAVGLQRVGRVFKLVVALALFERLGHQEGVRVQRGTEALLEQTDQRRIAGDPAGLQQRGLHRHVLGGLVHTFGDGAYAGANLQPCVPAAADKTFDALLQRGVGVRVLAVGQQHQHVHVRMREQLGPAKAAHRQQRKAVRKIRLLPQALQGTVGMAGQAVQEFADAPRRGAAVLHGLQGGGFLGAVFLAQGLDAGQVRVDVMNEGRGGLPADSVSTS